MSHCKLLVAACMHHQQRYNLTESEMKSLATVYTSVQKRTTFEWVVHVFSKKLAKAVK